LAQEYGVNGSRWKWPLIAFCGFAACWAIVAVPDLFGVGQLSWYGWWQADQPATGRPYEARFESVEPGGAPARAGIRDGDTFDLREQSFEARAGLAFQPIAHKSLTLVVHRDGRRRSVTVVPGAVWDVGRLGLLWAVPTAIACLWFAACALLIAVRRAQLFEGRVLALTLAVCAIGTVPLVTANAALTWGLLGLTVAAWALEWLFLAILSGAFGTRSKWRRVLEGARMRRPQSISPSS